ncbi:MAG: DUF1330 domain-containing protein [Rubrivivax sp.]
MAAYIWGNIEVTDTSLYEQYRQQVPSLIAKHGGRYRIRGGTAEVLEGDVSAQRIVLIEFDDMHKLKAFYTSSEYRTLIALRQRASHGSLYAVEGVAPV